VLLDEPLGALDVGTAPEIRQTLRTYLRDAGVTTILVTHDVVDAAVLTDRALVIQEGRIVESGPTGQLLATPRSSFGALLAGLNLASGTVVSVSGGDHGNFVTEVQVAPDLRITGYADQSLREGAPAIALFAPAAVVVGLTHAETSARNRWEATITDLQAGPSTVRLRAAGPIDTGIDVTPAAVADLDLRPGQPVVLSVKANEVRVHPA
jgi:molybdate transport system ATP-binding protein